jgi:DNA (cytosine-5)-methyltransferase 1
MITVVSTFSGVGGSSLGYKLAGCKVLASLEFIEEARACYRLNFPDTPIIEKDIRDVTGKEILKLIGLKKGELDILDGSPPCASFSMFGKRENSWGKVKNYSTTQQRTDDLFNEQIRLVEEIMPKAVVIENVKGMTLGIAKDLLKNYMVKLQKLGYNLNIEILNSQYYETATSRERLIIIGIRKDLNKLPSHPTPFCKPTTFEQATKHIKLSNKEKEKLRVTSKKLLYYLNFTKQGEQMCKYHKTESYFSHRRASMTKPCPTITVSSDIYHPLENRTLSISECKAVSSFPDDFQIIGSYNQQYERIGRAVPPNLMKHIALNLVKILES